MKRLATVILANWSKKLTVTIFATILIVFRNYFELTTDQLEALYVTAGGYLVGQGIADHGKEAEKLKERKHDI